MTWFAQVAHVAMKDVRQARVLLFVYIAAVAWATRDALKLMGPDSASPEGAMLFVVALGMFVVAVLVQSDSPTRSDALWASRPFDPSAVLAAKLFVAVAIVIGLPLVGQFVALFAIGAATERIPNLLLVAAWSYALWLLAAMLVAALTRELRSFALVLVSVGLFLLIAVSEALKGRHFFVGVRTQEIVTYVGAIGTTALVLALYRTRDTRLRTWVAGVAAATAMLSSTVVPWSGWVPSSSAATAEVEAVTRRAVVHAELVDRPGGARQEWLRLRVRTEGATATERFGLSVSSATIYLSNRSTLRVPIEDAGPYAAALEAQPFGRSTRGPIIAAHGYEVGGKLSTVQQAAVGAGFDSVTIDGRVTVSERRVLGGMAFAEHATLQFDVARLEITYLNRSADTVRLAMKIFSVDRSDAESMALGFNVPDLTLVNETRGEELAFRSGGGGGHGGALVLPGNEAYVSSAGYDTAPFLPAGHRFVVDDAWIGAARLVVSKWMASDSYPVRAKVAVSP
jgi:hypothetical protein